MRVLRTWALPFIVVALFAFAACRRGDDSPQQINAALSRLLESKPPTPLAGIWSDVRAFYTQRENAPAWVGDRGMLRAEAALQVLRTAQDHGFSPADYDETDLTQDLESLEESSREAPGRARRLAELDARITTALLALGHDVALGRSVPTSLVPTWKSRREAPDFVGTLVQASDGDLGTWLDALRPHHPEYAALQRALKDLRGQERKGAWPMVAMRTFKPGESHPSVAVLRQRLAASGELSADASGESPEYDKDVEAAVRAFQEHHALKGTGVADAATLSAMNVPLDDRINQVEANLERWRWMPDDFGPRHLLVNIPSYLLMAREDGKTVRAIRVVVGKLGHETPVFSGNMETVVFSPYWNVPDSIAEGETAPAAARDPDYLERNDIEILHVSKSGATSVDPANVDWDNPEALRQLTFRQRPGPKNALGHVKFLFPNAFNVYLHDTPADGLFARTGRAFSHGCVRVEEPQALAKYVLRDYPEWDQRRILAAMQAGVEKYVKLSETIPVHIVYFTSWVDEKGGLYFQPDVYGYDAKQTKANAKPD